MCVICAYMHGDVSCICIYICINIYIYIYIGYIQFREGERDKTYNTKIGTLYIYTYNKESPRRNDNHITVKEFHGTSGLGFSVRRFHWTREMTPLTEKQSKLMRSACEWNRHYLPSCTSGKYKKLCRID